MTFATLGGALRDMTVRPHQNPWVLAQPHQNPWVLAHFHFIVHTTMASAKHLGRGCDRMGTCGYAHNLWTLGTARGRQRNLTPPSCSCIVSETRCTSGCAQATTPASAAKCLHVLRDSGR